MTRALSGWVTSEWASRVSAFEPPRMATRRLPPFLGVSAQAWSGMAGSSEAPAAAAPLMSEPCRIRRRVKGRPSSSFSFLSLRSSMMSSLFFVFGWCSTRVVAPRPQQGGAEAIAVAAKDANAELDGLARFLEGPRTRHQQRRAELDLEHRRLARLGRYRLEQIIGAGRHYPR